VYCKEYTNNSLESNLKDNKLIIFMESIYPYHTTSTKQHNT